ncbi:MAG: DNA adenine methylase, partial [Nitrososphaerales archaeon]
NRVVPYPFAKWPGGKGRMIGHIIPRMPSKIETYFEPFLGSGAVFFELVRQNKFKHAVISDSCEELMNAYLVIQSLVEPLIKELQTGSYKYNKTNYLRIRAVDPTTLDPVQGAARFIYLRKTCFNGLYRVNTKTGAFNVPFGSYKNPVICDEENLRAISKALESVKVLCGDFEKAIAGAKEGDVVYFDPPYQPISKTSKFTGYNKTGFIDDDQRRLAACFEQLVESGVCCVLSNSYAPLTMELYAKHTITEHMGARSIGGPASYRKPKKEIIVSGVCKPSDDSRTDPRDHTEQTPSPGC